jgi:hypothetical protein
MGSRLVVIGRNDFSRKAFPGGKEDEVKGAPGTAAGLKVDRGQLCGPIE